MQTSRGSRCLGPFCALECGDDGESKYGGSDGDDEGGDDDGGGGGGGDGDGDGEDSERCTISADLAACYARTGLTDCAGFAAHAHAAGGVGVGAPRLCDWACERGAGRADRLWHNYCWLEAVSRADVASVTLRTKCGWAAEARAVIRELFAGLQPWASIQDIVGVVERLLPHVGGNFAWLAEGLGQLGEPASFAPAWRRLALAANAAEAARRDEQPH